MADRAVLKERDILLVSDECGDIASHNSDGHGLYWRDTRFLSLYELKIADTKPALLSSAGEHNFMNNLQFANSALVDEGGVQVAARTISIRRNRFIQDGLQERIGFFNYNPVPLKLQVTIALGSDFRDMFDVRGYTSRAAHGVIEKPRISARTIHLAYLGLDNVRRGTEIRFDPHPTSVALLNLDLPLRIERRELPGISGHGDPRTEYSVTPPSAEVTFDFTIRPEQHHSITVHIEPLLGSKKPFERQAPALDAKFILIRDSYLQWEAESTDISTDHEILNRVVQRAASDLRLLSDPTPGGYLPSAGIPWFAAPFGRDSLITSLETLALRPDLGIGTLRYLAERQGEKLDDWRDEEPGKILHEVRMGEVASLGQVPQTPYYGSVDSTPLFLVTANEVLDWTDDHALAHELEPHLVGALDWIDRYGDIDGDGYVEYVSRSTSGIRNQGWKDSIDAIAYPNGRLVDPPIALSEVQGYVYDARLRMAKFFRRRGQPERGAEQERRAADLKQRFKRDFMIADGAYYSIALGPDKLPVQVVASNPGHCLWSGLLDGEEGLAAARRILQEDMNCGWGVRTLSSREPMFNPMSYHNGSVWPHDNALIAAGLKRLGLDAEAARLIGTVLETAMRFPHHRLPELFCGFTRDRRYFSMPAQYPVSCSPQAWAAGSVFLMLQTLLGLRVDAPSHRLELRPSLPSWLNRITVRRLRVADHRIDFEVCRANDEFQVEVWDSGGLEIAVERAAVRPIRR